MDLYSLLCSYENLELAFRKARRGKTLKPYVIEFEEKLDENLRTLQQELLFHTYRPKPLETFILRDPKTRKISKSAFRDRIIHHAICNIIEPLFDKCFIFDSYANRIGKGTFKAIQRFEYFAQKVSRGFTRPCFVFKTDIRHYFETVDHKILLSILQRKIDDRRLLWLIKIILRNYKTGHHEKGMPLGNLTSQFFANVYLNELDQYVKHTLKTKYYIRYVDDFVILDNYSKKLDYYRDRIDEFCRKRLALQLHPDKSKIHHFKNGVGFLGMRLYQHCRRIKKKNVSRFERKLLQLKNDCQNGNIIREKAVEHFEGWLAYITNANTFKYRKHLVRQFNQFFPLTPKAEIKNIAKYQNFIKTSEQATHQFSVQKTLLLWKKGKGIKEIAELRGIKEATVWQHFANLIEYNQLSLWKILPKEKIESILAGIHSERDTLKDIKAKLQNIPASYDEINCALAYVKSKNRAKNILYHVNWYQKVHCLRKCYFDKKQRNECSGKFDTFISRNPSLKMKRKDFIAFFNDHLSICVLPNKEKESYISWKQFQQAKKLFLKKKKEPTFKILP
ncbi:helix-turn-helix domain-containing protein [Candidatus Woesearchaeota archaeon]|nr:helix-turn-helix domain-containing protein [Candidatus Woesearchaeota archaeon]